MPKKEKKELYHGLQMAILVIFYSLSLMLPMFIRLVVPVSNDDYISTTCKIIILSFATFYLIPFKIGIPMFGDGKENLKAIGLGFEKIRVNKIVLGIALGAISLLFMLLGSIIAGNYVWNPSVLSLKHIYFSVVPGIFEEVIFRGFMMIVLLKYYKNIKKAACFQVFLFSLAHVKDITLWGMIDVLTVAVIAIAFTYVVFKTGQLFTAILFHFVHDAFLYIVQQPGGVYQGLWENIVFYSFVWMGMFFIMYLTKRIMNSENTENNEKSYLGICI